MKPEVANIITVLERPLQFIAAQKYQNIHVVKNIDQHIQGQCVKAFALIADTHQQKVLKSLHQLFAGYQQLDVTQKQACLQRALLLVEEFKYEPSIDFGYKAGEHAAHSPEDLKDAYMALTSRVQYAKGVGPALAGIFNKHKVASIYDLLHQLPYRYEDRSTLKKIAALTDDEKQTFVATVTYAGPTFYKGSNRRFFEVMLEDETGELRLKWFRFHLAAFQKKFKKDQQLIVSGKVKTYKNNKEVHHPDVEVFAGGKEALSFGKVVPVYSEIGGIYQKTMRKIMHFLVLQYCEKRLALLPPKLSEKYKFLPPWKVLLHLHQPDKIPTDNEINELKRHLAFEELFFYALAYGLRKKQNVATGIAFDKETEKIVQLKAALPFNLTSDQDKVLGEILQDMKSAKAMNRLLQGDVGSGKTIVAFMAALHAIENGHQVALMAPTELLAKQHYDNMQAWAKTTGTRMGIIVGKLSKGEKQAIAEQLQRGDVDMVVGTHALIEDYVQYQSLGLVIIDEQHRFGVKQKDQVRTHAMRPDVLIMSATPIPRSLAMTLFGDIDVSVLLEMPKGRKVIATTVVKEKEIVRVYAEIEQTVLSGQQVFMVYPLVESSEFLDAKDAVGQFDYFQQQVFPKRRLGLLHGQMKAEEKNKIMQQFANGQIDILVATTVIEVGIDVPNATLMVIEHPERFGLAQLHQLRGRVGRGEKPGRCILVQPDALALAARDRLKRFSQIHNGFDLAQEDLKSRGPGDFFGVAQSGMPNFSMAEFPRDLDLLETTRREALEVLQQDPELKQSGHQHLTWVLDVLWKDRTKYIDVA